MFNPFRVFCFARDGVPDGAPAADVENEQEQHDDQQPETTERTGDAAAKAAQTAAPAGKEQLGFAEGDMTLVYQTERLTQDRGTGFTVDEMNVDESGVLDLMCLLAGEFQRTRVVPEVDSYRLSKIAKLVGKDRRSAKPDVFAEREERMTNIEQLKLLTEELDTPSGNTETGCGCMSPPASARMYTDAQLAMLLELHEGDGMNIAGRWYTVLHADVQMGILCDVVLKEGEPDGIEN